jgi:phenylalanyl-tRNA synthetase alpha chain
MMSTLKDQIITCRQELQEALKVAKSDHELEQTRITFLGRTGRVAQLMTHLKELSPEDKRTFGPLLNELRQWSEQAYEEKKQILAEEQRQQAAQRQKHFDVTAYKPGLPKGSIHVLTDIIEQLQGIFTSMGYTIADGPELETEHHNFVALNIPADHPARDMQDTFWLPQPHTLLRTHTSNIQIRTMEKNSPPLAIFGCGRVYRPEATDASHDFMFMQAECLMVDKNISVANLLATIQTFVQEYFGKKDLKVRVRPGYFPFVEPGLEVDAACPFCTTGCSVCKRTGWIELGGSGLVHPNVLRCCNIDPEIYSAFAFGFGLERLAMIRHGINDIRLMRSSTIDFLDQF